MIRGKVIDPKLTLDNPDIARRHIRAFLLQAYHEARLSTTTPRGVWESLFCFGNCLPIQERPISAEPKRFGRLARRE